MKELFTVEGNTWQKKAFVEQLEAEGFKKAGVHHLDDGVYLKPHKDKSEGKVIGYQEDSYPIHYSLSTSWQEAIEAFRDYYKEGELVVGKWYTCGNRKSLLKYSEESLLTGFNADGEWSEFQGRANIDKFKPATQEEIQTALENEAKKRGFKIGVKHHAKNLGYTWDSATITNEFRGFEYDINEDVLWLERYRVYENGKWAELLPSTPDITINGYKAEFKENGVSFNNDCAVIHKRVFADAVAFIKKFNAADGVTNRNLTSIAIGKGTFTVSQIEEINNYFTKGE